MYFFYLCICYVFIYLCIYVCIHDTYVYSRGIELDVSRVTNLHCLAERVLPVEGFMGPIAFAIINVTRPV